jgi:hypothetical protein
MLILLTLSVYQEGFESTAVNKKSYLWPCQSPVILKIVQSMFCYLTYCSNLKKPVERDGLRNKWTHESIYIYIYILMITAVG